MIRYYDSLSLSLSHFMENEHEIIPPIAQTFDYRKQNILVPVHHLEITHHVCVCIKLKISLYLINRDKFYI